MLSPLVTIQYNTIQFGNINTFHTYPINEILKKLFQVLIATQSPSKNDLKCYHGKAFSLQIIWHREDPHLNLQSNFASYHL